MAERWTQDVPFKSMDERKDEPVKYDDRPNVEAPLTEHSKAQPPGNVADPIEIVEADDGKSGVPKLVPKFLAIVAAMVAEILVERRGDYLVERLPIIGVK